MVELPNVTMICIDTLRYAQAINAIVLSQKQIKPARTVFLTDIDLYNPGFEIIQIDKITSKEQYSEFIVKELHKYFNTDYCLIIQWDGYVLDGKQWRDEFLEYDVVGAKWLYVDGRNVSNGGFSLRSKRLQTILATDEAIEICHPEDEIIGRLYRKYLENTHSIKFPSEELCDKFSFELNEPYCPTFGFHGHFHPPFKETVVIKRTGAMGDVIQVEPVLHYFWQKGYRVVLDTLPQFYSYFQYHHYPILHISQLNPKLSYRLIDLDMSYENNPKQLHLKTYYEAAGITDGEIKNPTLTFKMGDNEKLFPKYCILHIDKREQPHRNIYGPNWEYIARNLKEKGYSVFQIGLGEHETIMNATQINTPNQLFLMWLLAGADLFIGIDSGPSHIAASFNIPSILFFGSVNPAYIHPDLTNTIAIHNHDKKVCETPYCWHESVTCVGQDCSVNKLNPPCTNFTTIQVIDAIQKISNHDKN